MSSPAVQTASSTTAASGTSITLTKPTGVVAGNLLIAGLCGSLVGAGPTAPSGWTMIANVVGAVAWWWKVATDQEPSSYAFTWTGASVSAGIIVRVSGENVSNGIEATGALNNASSANIVAPSVQPKWNADLLVSIYFDNAANTITVPGGQSNIGGTTGNSRAVICGYETLASNAATGTRTATATAATNQAINIVVSADPGVGLLLPAGFASIPEYFGARGGASSGPTPNCNNIFGVNGLYTGRQIFSPYAGIYKVAGTVTDGGSVPTTTRQVMLSPWAAPGLVIASSFTDAITGTFLFNNIAPGKYIVEALNPDGTEDGVIHVYIDAVAM